MAHLVVPVHEENGADGAGFPDCPSATTVASDLDTLSVRAAGMLAFHAAGMAEDGDALPPPRSVSERRDDPASRENSADAIIGLIDVDRPGKAVRVNLSVEESILRRIDRAAAKARLAGGSASGR
ncbi:type II toxin-antitoxin system HicB family antitoxin [Methylobacterium frigidaeris]|uniref:HicB-like antitoxin of toxin-antitoxin system domain-containing protein n=1 Tax=Methylobacterium frigidaeris TaxID=2038277 RepID=A0AA37M4J9_9HYPH|nr:type II toxin-antitoxin system HicB family antitoxin [Methylobacterium frigidaeris]PIK74751.1 HicB family protein [Methylobacterium frigidaeris]GJD62154.1 hypothetical protein MPEAHAMD_2305 [Methylobacterium frigidaeris]